MQISHLILVINPGSTSTKIAVYDNEKEILSSNISHSTKELSEFKCINDQYTLRKKLIIKTLEKQNVKIQDIKAVVGRGGLLKPIHSGTYEVTDELLKDLKEAKRGEHASNLGGIIANSIAKEAACSSYIVDPVVVDEMEEIARLSGNPELPRISIFHALNHKAAARKAATQLGKKYENLNLIIAHLGGGISVGIHRKGRVVDVNNALDGDGPYSPERSGGVPAGQLANLCFTNKFTDREIKKQIKGSGGLVAYLETNDAREILEMINGGDTKAKLIYEGMAYQIAKEIGSLSSVVSGEIDAIILTGGLANDKTLTDLIKKKVSFLSKIIIYPGENEMGALRDGVLRVCKQEDFAKKY